MTEPSDFMTSLAAVQQAVASGELVMAQTDSERIEELERQIRCVQIYGYGYLLNHGGKQIALDPKDVTVVIPSTRHMDDFDLNNSLYLAEQQVQVLQERIRKVREMAGEIECANCDHPAKHHAPICNHEFRGLQCMCDWKGVAHEILDALNEEGEKAPSGNLSCGYCSEPVEPSDAFDHLRGHGVEPQVWGSAENAACDLPTRIAVGGGRLVHNPPFSPPADCLCTWLSQFEGEQLGMAHSIHAVDRRCPMHGHKPRWPKAEDQSHG